MTINELLVSLNTTGIRFAHFAWSHSPDEEQYAVFSETSFEAEWRDNKKCEEKMIGEIDLFTKSDVDGCKMSVENVLDSLGVGYSLGFIDYESDTGYIHYKWNMEVTYGEASG